MSSDELKPPVPGSKGRSRRGRPPSIDSVALLEVARQVFLEQGFRATTQEVAERAGISEGLLFHRFKTKESLFREAMNLPHEALPDLLLHAVEKLDGMELREALVHLASAVLEIGKVGIPLMMMSWSNPNHCNDMPYDKTKARFREVMKRLAAYFESQMESGKLRHVDPEVIARTFVGSMHHYCMTRILAGNEAGAMIPESMFVRGLVDLVLDGILPRPQTSAT
jgi:AcrR family transcriptional regulator